MSDVWEPWTPQVGQRVRIKLSTECPQFFGNDFDGAIGTVVDAVTNEYLISHGYTHGHRFEVGIDGGPKRIYAAAELEPAS